MEITQSKIELNEQILASKAIKGGYCLFVGRIVDVREKAVKVDYAIEPISVGSGSPVTVFLYSVWMPKSVILNDDRGGLTCKPWFLREGLKNSHHIKRYMLNDRGEKSFV